MSRRNTISRELLSTIATVLVLGLAAVGMYLLVLRGEKILNDYWGVRA